MLRVGSVPYLVGRPLDSGLEDEPGIDFGYAVPSALVEGLRAGTLDVALVSSIELFRRPGYGFLDGLAVAGDAGVSSVQVFLRRSVAEVRSVALDPASRTAATLTQIVWPARRRAAEDEGRLSAGERPRFVPLQPGDDPVRARTDAYLVIGDEALRETYAPNAPPTFNPSEHWARRTGLPFVFAVWIVRPGVDLAPWTGAFLRARARGASRIEELAALGARQWDLPLDAVRRYLLEECSYEPGAHLEPSLLAFRDGAAALGLAEGDLRPHRIPLGAAAT